MVFFKNNKLRFQVDKSLIRALENGHMPKKLDSNGSRSFPQCPVAATSNAGLQMWCQEKPTKTMMSQPGKSKNITRLEDNNENT